MAAEFSAASVLSSEAELRYADGRVSQSGGMVKLSCGMVTCRTVTVKRSTAT
jgi:hypothetical protein